MRDKEKSSIIDKIKTGVAIGVAVVGGYSNAYQNITPSPLDVAAGRQRSQDLSRRKSQFEPREREAKTLPLEHARSPAVAKASSNRNEVRDTRAMEPSKVATKPSFSERIAQAQYKPKNLPNRRRGGRERDDDIER